MPQPGHKAVWCRHIRTTTKEECSLYAKHYGDHKGKHLATSWTDEEGEYPDGKTSS